MTDPFLQSGSGEESVPPARPGRHEELALRAGIPRAIAAIIPAEVLERFVTCVESGAELAADVRQALNAAGLHQHDPQGPGGGFYIASHLRDDGVVVSWATRQNAPDEYGPFEKTIDTIMQPALQAILVACGFVAQRIPDGHDDAGCVLVAGRAGTPA